MLLPVQYLSGCQELQKEQNYKVMTLNTLCSTMCIYVSVFVTVYPRFSCLGPLPSLHLPSSPPHPLPHSSAHVSSEYTGGQKNGWYV